MKVLAPLVILAVKYVAAQTSACAADFILERCLATEEPKAQECSSQDYECMCHAYEAIATCYNNCPDDPRLAPAQNQVLQYCRLVETSSSAASVTDGIVTQAPVTRVTSTSTPTSEGEQNERASSTATSSAGQQDQEDVAGGLVIRSPELVIGVVGVIAALL